MTHPLKLALAVALAAAIASPVAAATTGSRVRVANHGTRGAVDVLLSDSQARTAPEQRLTGPVESGEVIVEAAAPRGRLRGGSLGTDPLLEAMVRSMTRGQSGPFSYVIADVDTFRAPAGSRYAPGIWPAWTDEGYWSPYSAGFWTETSACYPAVDRPVRSDRWERRPSNRHDPSPRPSPAPRGSFSARAMMPRR